MYVQYKKTMQKLIAFLSITLVVGCLSAPDKKIIEKTINPAVDTASNVKTPGDGFTNIAGCYMQVLKRDTFTASLQQTERLITGRLSFDNYEKDASSGTVSGKIQGDVIKLNYVFASEGTTSVMELYVRYKDCILTRGSGEMNTRGDTAYFLNPALIKYDGGELKKVSCETLADKYK